MWGKLLGEIAFETLSFGLKNHKAKKRKTTRKIATKRKTATKRRK